MKETTSKRKYIFRFEAKPPHKENTNFVLKRKRFKSSEERYRFLVEQLEVRVRKKPN